MRRGCNHLMLNYVLGLQRLKAQLPAHVRRDHLDTLEARLLHVLDEIARYGPTPTLREERLRVVEQLNALARKYLERSFNDLCTPEADADTFEAPPIPPGHNPFGLTGRITDPARFFDRVDLLRRVFQELNKGVNISLVGVSQVGKSSVLAQVCAQGPQRMRDTSVSFQYLNLEWVDDEEDFYAALADALKLGHPLRGYHLTRALRGTRHVLCLDEIEKMTWEGFTVKLRSHLRGLADGPAAPLKLVIASRSPLARLFPDSPELDSPLFSVCHQLDVPPFPPRVVRAFLRHHLRGTGVTYSEAEIARLIAQTGGHPGKLHRAAATLFAEKRKDREDRP